MASATPDLYTVNFLSVEHHQLKLVLSAHYSPFPISRLHKNFQIGGPGTPRTPCGNAFRDPKKCYKHSSATLLVRINA